MHVSFGLRYSVSDEGNTDYETLFSPVVHTYQLYAEIEGTFAFPAKRISIFAQHNSYSVPSTVCCKFLIPSEIFRRPLFPSSSSTNCYCNSSLFLLQPPMNIIILLNNHKSKFSMQYFKFHPVLYKPSEYSDNFASRAKFNGSTNINYFLISAVYLCLHTRTVLVRLVSSINLGKQFGIEITLCSSKDLEL